MNRFTRFYNFLIDSICYFFMIIILLLILKQFNVKKDLSYFMILFYYLYYFTFEFFGGQTIGKMITKTKVGEYQKWSETKCIKNSNQNPVLG